METIVERLLPAAPRAFRTTLITNSDASSPEAVERTTESGGTTDAVRALGLGFPPSAFSLSHVALPFPVTDPLYGSQPGPDESFGLNLGTLTPRGERGVLMVPLDALVRISSNPFYPYIEGRISEAIDAPATSGVAPGAGGRMLGFPHRAIMTLKPALDLSSRAGTVRGRRARRCRRNGAFSAGPRGAGAPSRRRPADGRSLRVRRIAVPTGSQISSSGHGFD
jgi:hypothetical protein